MMHELRSFYIVAYLNPTDQLSGSGQIEIISFFNQDRAQEAYDRLKQAGFTVSQYITPAL